jgi:hypothetical protein
VVSGVHEQRAMTPEEVAEHPAPPSLPPVMDHGARTRARTAAFRVGRLYPGPVGEVLALELRTWEQFGYRLGGDSMIARLVEHVMGLDLEDDAAA